MNFQKLKCHEYSYNQTIMELYGVGDNKKIKLVLMNALRNSGVETNKEKVFSSYDFKLSQSISRSKKIIFELAFCNEWNWFFTGTLNPNVHDRTDLNKFHRDLTLFLRRYGVKNGLKIHFLLVPELHDDGKSWHVHGLISGLPLSHLKQFEIGDKMSKKLLEKVLNGEKIYNWLEYSRKFGFCDLELIKNHEAVSKYITKYINKKLGSDVKEQNAHTYYCSRGLRRAEKIKIGSMNWGNIESDYKNEYCSVATLDYTPELFNNLLNSFI